MTMRKLLFFLAMIPLCSMAQSRYCATWQDFLDGNWKEAEGRVELVPSAKEDPLAMDIEADKKRTAGILRKRAIVLSQHDSLYINLRPFNTFGDVYVRAWRVGSDKLLFARQDVAPSRFSVTYGGTNTPLNSNSFRTFSRLEYLVCYLAVWNPHRDELSMVRLTRQMVLQLLTNHLQQRTAYEQTDKSRQEDADVIITTLQAAGVIGR